MAFPARIAPSVSTGSSLFTFASFAIASVAVFALGCSSGSTTSATDAGAQDPGLTGPGTGGGTEVNSYGTPYPSDNLGYTPRAGSTPGNRVRNYKFLGYKNPQDAKELSTISLADYFDPEVRAYKVIHLVASSVWCGPCQQETEEINKVIDVLGEKKVVFVQALIDGPKQGTGATSGDLDKWVKGYGNPFPTMLDPNVKNLGEFFQAAAVPWNANIDARSMEILSATLGAPRDVSADVLKWVKWVDENAPYAAQ